MQSSSLCVRYEEYMYLIRSLSFLSHHGKKRICNTFGGLSYHFFHSIVDYLDVLESKFHVSTFIRSCFDSQTHLVICVAVSSIQCIKELKYRAFKVIIGPWKMASENSMYRIQKNSSFATMERGFWAKNDFPSASTVRFYIVCV